MKTGRPDTLLWTVVNSDESNIIKQRCRGPLTMWTTPSLVSDRTLGWRHFNWFDPKVLVQGLITVRSSVHVSPYLGVRTNRVLFSTLLGWFQRDCRSPGTTEIWGKGNRDRGGRPYFSFLGQRHLCREDAPGVSVAYEAYHVRTPVERRGSVMWVDPNRVWGKTDNDVSHHLSMSLTCFECLVDK